MNTNDLSIEAKIVLLGETGVGKTSMVLRFAEQRFSHNVTPTIGASFLSKTICIDGARVKMQLWDTAGQERFRSLAPMYYRGANAAILVYDVTSEQSFLRVKEWVRELRTNVFEDILMIVVGNQVDKAKHQVHPLEAAEYAQSIGASFLEVSARMNTGVEEVFMRVVKYLVDIHSTTKEITEGFSHSQVYRNQYLIEPGNRTCCS